MMPFSLKIQKGHNKKNTKELTTFLMPNRKIWFKIKCQWYGASRRIQKEISVRVITKNEELFDVTLYRLEMNSIQNKHQENIGIIPHQILCYALKVMKLCSKLN